ncbi:3849_t:CDS:2, partial [Diversispora eburnea]
LSLTVVTLGLSLKIDISGFSLTVIILGPSLTVVILELPLSLWAELILCISSCNRYTCLASATGVLLSNNEALEVTSKNNEALEVTSENNKVLGIIKSIGPSWAYLQNSNPIQYLTSPTQNPAHIIMGSKT